MVEGSKDRPGLHDICNATFSSCLKVWHWYICLHSFLSLSSLNVWMHHSSGSEINYSFNFVWFPLTFYWASEQQFIKNKFHVWACYDLELWLHFEIILSFSENPRPAPRRRPRLYDKAFADRDSDAEVKDLPSEKVANQAFYYATRRFMQNSRLHQYLADKCPNVIFETKKEYNLF